jgi:DNA-binding transcriptional ArsR family regulator
LTRDPLQPEECAQLLGVLADPDRLRIVWLLRDGPRNVSEITSLLNLKIANASHHLIVLRQSGLVEHRKRGRYVYYSLAEGVHEVDEQARLPERLNLGCCRLQLPNSRPAEKV